MGQGLTTSQELKIENSRHVANVTLVLIPIVVGIVAYVLQFRQTGDLFWVLSIASILCFAVSLYFGGRGTSHLRRDQPEKFSSFNAQAVLCVTGFLLLGSLYFALGKSKEDEIEKELDKVTLSLEQLNRDFKVLDTQLKNEMQRSEKNYANFKVEIGKISDSVSSIHREVGVLDGRLRQLTENQAEQNGALNADKPRE